MSQGSSRPARTAMALAATLAGSAIAACRTTACHALAHAAGGIAGLTHGEALAALTPAAMRRFMLRAPGRYAEVGALLAGRTGGDAGRADPQGSAAAVERLIADVGLTRGLGAQGVARKDLPAIADAALDYMRGAIEATPVEVTREDLVADPAGVVLRPAPYRIEWKARRSQGTLSVRPRRNGSPRDYLVTGRRAAAAEVSREGRHETIGSRAASTSTAASTTSLSATSPAWPRSSESGVLALFLERGPDVSLAKVTLEEQGGKVLFHTSFNPYFGETLKQFALTDFITELTAHSPPKGVHYIRRYGLYSSRTRSRWSRLLPARRGAPCLPRFLHLGPPDLKGLGRRSLRLPSLRPPAERPRRHHRPAADRQDPAPPVEDRPPAPGARPQRAATDCFMIAGGSGRQRPPGVLALPGRFRSAPPDAAHHFPYQQMEAPPTRHSRLTDNMAKLSISAASSWCDARSADSQQSCCRGGRVVASAQKAASRPP